MKKSIFVSLLLLAFGVTLGQPRSNHFSGRVRLHLDEETFANGGKVSLLFYNPELIRMSYMPDTVLTSPIDTSGAFSLAFDAPSPLFYLAIKFETVEKPLFVNQEFLLRPYLCQQGDSITLNLEIYPKKYPATLSLDNKAWFTGTGADKYNCQYLISHYSVPMEAMGPFFNLGYIKGVGSREKYERVHTDYRLGIIESFQGRIADSILTRLKHNVVAAAKYQFTKAWLKDSYAEQDEEHQQAVVAFVNVVHNHSSLYSRADELTGARGYADFILVADELTYRIKNKISNISSNKHLPPKEYVTWMFDNIKNNYSGALRESLLLTWLASAETSRKFYNELIPIIPEAKAMLSSNSRRAVLDKLLLSDKGSDSFPFEYMDEKGNHHRLADYADKIMVLDFWFTGCHGCTAIPPVMKHIMERFKYHKDVLFLSISIDATQKIWRSGLASGLYTLPGQIHLKTIGSGRLDPFIINYNINGYPKIMVIGKKGKMITANPTDPRIDRGKDIIRLIEKEL